MINKKSKTLSLNDISFDEREINSVLKILKSGWISNGKNVKKFENKFATFIGSKYGIAVNSGSSANLIALSAVIKKYNIKKGDEVIIPAATFATVPMPIIQLGLIPVYVDINLDDLNIDVLEIEKAISKKTKIIMPVHTLGIPAKMKEINKIAKKRNLIVIEDCCEAHGAKVDGKYVGSLGKLSCFSFFVAHHITTGEGGMVLTDDKELRDICISLREFGRINQNEILKNRYYSDDILKNYDKRYVFKNIGYNLRMTEIAAGIGNEQIKKMKRMIQIRISNTKYLYRFFKKKYNNFFDFPKLQFDGSHSFYTFPIIIKKNISIDRKKLCQYLEKHKIETRPLMAGCLPDQPGLRNQPKRIVGKLTKSRFVRDNLFFIGVHPGLNESNFKYLFDVLDNFFLINKNKFIK